MSGVLEPGRYDTDKSRLYLRNYERFFAPLAAREIRLLELGVHRGGSLHLWRDYFPRGLIVGLDIQPIEVPGAGDRIRTYRGSQDDVALLDRMARESAPDGFDIIIDDASHLGELTRKSFRHLFPNHLKRGGVYVLEDWRVGYWQAWSDGSTYTRPSPPGLLDRLLRRKWRVQSHSYGMVGVVKELVDELGQDMITHPGRDPHGGPHRVPAFQRMEVHPGQVFVVKATDADDALVREQSGLSTA